MKQFTIVLAMGLAFTLILPAGCARQTAYTSAAYLAVTPPKDPDRRSDGAAALDALKRSYVSLATDDAVLRRAVDEDAAQDGVKLNRIRKTAWFTGDSNTTVQSLRDKLSVAAIERTNLIRLSLSGPNPRRLPQVVNAVADAMVYQAARQLRQKRAAKRETATARLEEIHGQISDKQKAIEKLQGESEVPLMRERRNIIQMTLQSLTTELTQLGLLKAQAQAALNALKNEAMRKNLESQLAAIDKRLLEVRHQYTEMSQRLRDLGVTLNQIGILEAEIERLQDRDSQMMEVVTTHYFGDYSPLNIQTRAEIPAKPSP